MRYQPPESAPRAARVNSALTIVVELDESIDRGLAAPAATACATGFTDLMLASGAIVDALANHPVVDRVAVAHEHG